MSATFLGVSLLVAQASAARGYRPFLDPLPLHDVWWLTLIPLALGISVAYKAIRVSDMSRYWRQVGLMTAQIIAGMIGLAAIVFIVVEIIATRV